MKKGTKHRAPDSPPAAAPLRNAPSAIDAISSLIGNDRLLDLVLSNVSDLIVIMDRDGRRIYNSPSYAEVLGDPEALRGTSGFTEIHPDDRDRIRRVFEETLSTGKGQAARFRFLFLDGSVRHIQSRGHVVRDAQGEIRCLLVISRDITAQLLTRDRLDETEATFRGLVENSLTGVYILVDGRFQYVNPRIAEITGYTARELTGGKDFTEIVAPEERELAAENIRRQMDGSVPSLWYALRIVRKDDAIVTLEVSGTRTTIDGHPALVGTVLDVTERKRSEALQLALYRITEMATTVIDLTAFYEGLHTILGELMYARNFYIALYDEVTEDLTFPYFVDEFDAPPPPQKLGRGLTEYVLRTSRPLLASPEVFQTLVDEGEVVLLGGPSVDWLGAPLLRGDAAFGVIVVQSYSDAHRFGTQEQEILNYISRHIAVAIDRKRTESALRESEEKHRAIIAGMGDGVVLHDATGAVVSWNPSAIRILDLAPETLVHWARADILLDRIHEDGHPYAPDEHPVLETLKTGRPLTDSVMGFRTAGGARRWISINTQPLLRAGNEKPHAAVASFADITRRKEAENALYRSEQRFRSLVEAIPDWIWETDADGRYTYASPKVMDLLGYEPAEVLGKRPRDFMHPVDAQRFALQMTGHISRTEPFFGFQNRHVRKDGRVVVLETSGVPVVDDTGRFRGYRGIDRDVTARKEGEEELARLKMAVEQAAESIVITEVDGKIVYVNPAFERVTGYARAESLGRTPRVLRSNVHDVEFYRTMWQTLLGGEVWSGHITNRRKDGSLYNEEMVISPVRDASGKIVNFVAVKRDMTHEMEMERRLRQSQKMESLGQLAGGIAHDFNNVLGVIQGGLALLKSRIADPALMRYIDIGESAVNRGADVAKRLLTFSRDGQVALRPMALADVARELMIVLEHSIEKTVELVSDIPHDLPIIQGDPGQIYQMLLNLCLNARDAILEAQPESGTGRITVAASEIPGDNVRKEFHEATAHSYVRISVTDTGAGMSEQVRSRLFEPFFTTKPTGKGTGLGLAVVYGIIQSHHGIVDVESAPGEGTTFHIYLQAYPEEFALPAPEISAPLVGGSETILVVEDDEALRDLVTELLRSYGYAVICAEDGVEGLEQFTERREEIKVVITDMGLPRMSGQDMFARIRDLDPSARVVLASGYLEPGLKSKLFIAGAKAFIQKPYQPQEIVRVVREILDRPDGEDETP
jgi:two-component system, cell cycle sensor histidine kinase and response regulator CckA